jgi:hypothetical protein
MKCIYLCIIIGCLRSKPRARASARASDVFGHMSQKHRLLLLLVWGKQANFQKIACFEIAWF